ncbi:MAG: hypothetical protein R3A47_11935 [Polyangiales bacterium]
MATSLLFANVAFACPLCIAAKEESRLAFVSTTAFLSLLPLGLIGGTIWWIRRRAIAADQTDPVERFLERPLQKGPKK